MKKGFKILCLAVALIAVFLLGWRVMPLAWPSIKEAVVYPVMPRLKPTPAPTMESYHPESSAEFGDPIAVSDSLIYYFYKDYCSYCRQLKPLMAGLPETVTLPDGTQSAVKLVCLNKVEQPMLEVITAYYDQHDIPQDRRYVPAVVIGGRYLHLADEIVGQLMDALTNGEGLTTPLLDGGQRVE